MVKMLKQTRKNTMRVAIGIGGYARTDNSQMVDFVQKAEAMGVDSCFSAEAWGGDAVTSLAYLAALTSKIKLGTGIMQISARVPAMTAMTAVSMSVLSNNRFILGLGASGPQVVEGLHGVAYAGPLTRLKENVQIIRMACAREKIHIDGKYHQLPRPGGEGKALRLDIKPVHIPIYLATLGPKALEFTGAAADGWLGTSFSPDFADAHLAYIRAGAEQAGRSLDDIDLHAATSVTITDAVDEAIEASKMGVAFQMGAMGSAKTNFYNDAFCRAGFEGPAKEIQRLWKEGLRDQAASAVPDDMVTKFQLIGTPAMIADRLQVYKKVGINCINARLAPDKDGDKIELLEQFMDIANGA